MVIAGTTAGVLDAEGRTVTVLDPAAVRQLIDSGTATAGMVAKLRACEQALASGVGDVVIVDGRDASALRHAALGAATRTSTRLIAEGAERTL
jgi:acetylglutamate kinase